MKLLFVCANNFIRSPFAEHALRAAIKSDAHLSGTVIDSAGAFAGQESRALSPRAIDEARAHGVDLTNHRTKSTDRAELIKADLIVPMDEDSNWFVTEELRTRAEAAHAIRRFVTFLPDISLREIADPIIDGVPYDETYELIQKGVLEIRRWLLVR